jgi:hypothetical protein
MEPEAKEPKLGANRGNAGRGRPKGSKNKATTALKDAILGALSSVGGQAYLERVAAEDPRTFCTLLGKVLPMTVAGDPDAAPVEMVVRWKS